MTLELSIDCCFCGKSYRTEIVLPPGWEHRTGGVDSEVGFCPDHAKVAPFADAQCPGCVGGWGDCPMWRAFAFSHDRSIGPDDYKALEVGQCPRRVNGTICIDRARGTMTDLDLSDQATVEAGRAFAQAIREYVTTYPACG